MQIGLYRRPNLIASTYEGLRAFVRKPSSKWQVTAWQWHRKLFAEPPSDQKSYEGPSASRVGAPARFLVIPSETSEFGRAGYDPAVPASPVSARHAPSHRRQDRRTVLILIGCDGLLFAPRRCESSSSTSRSTTVTVSKNSASARAPTRSAMLAPRTTHAHRAPPSATSLRTSLWQGLRTRRLRG